MVSSIGGYVHKGVIMAAEEASIEEKETTATAACKFENAQKGRFSIRLLVDTVQPYTAKQLEQAFADGLKPLYVKGVDLVTVEGVLNVS